MSASKSNPPGTGQPRSMQWLGWLVGVVGFFSMLAIGLFILIDPRQGPLVIGLLLTVVGVLGQAIMGLLFYWRKTASAFRATQPARPASVSLRRPAALVDAAGRRYPLGPEAVIGRDPASQLRIEPGVGEAFHSVSSRHARVFQEAESGRYYIEDLDSLNGVFIGDAPTRLNPLNDGDQIRLGALTLEFQQPGETQGAQ